LPTGAAIRPTDRPWVNSYTNFSYVPTGAGLHPEHKIINDRFKLNFTVAIRPRNTLYDHYFGMVSHGKSGSFCGVDEGTQMFKELIARYDFSTEAGAIGFAEELLDHMCRDYRDPKKPAAVIGKQMKGTQQVESGVISLVRRFC